jgi:hypothetical protein
MAESPPTRRSRAPHQKPDSGITDTNSVTLTAIAHARERWAAYQLDLKPTEADGVWTGQCPFHRVEHNITIEEGARLDDPVTINPCPGGCTPEEIMRVLSLDGHAQPPEQWARARARITQVRFGSPDAASQYLRVVAALTAQGYAGRRSDMSGVAQDGRYQCPVCGAAGDGHGLKVAVGRDQPVVLHCFACQADVADILEALDLTWSDVSRPLPELTELVDEPVGNDSTSPDSWAPVDLTPYLDGKIARPEPTVGLARSDGLRLLYPGKEHTVIGEMESAKSWFACGCCAEELTNGNRVLYIHFEEADPGDTIERLQALGVPKATIAARFTFVGPDQPVTPEKLARLLANRPTLVILDGVNEAMSLQGLKVREEDGAATFRRLFVKPCTAVSAATLAADHVVKDKERRGRDALGSVHKGNGLTGALILLENVEPFGRGLRGRSHLFVTKDRPGHLRRNGRPSGIPGKTHLGELVVDDTRALHRYLDLTFWAPKDQAAEQPAEQSDTDEAAVLQAVADIAGRGKPANLRTLRAVLKGIGKDRVDNALAMLTLDGRLVETLGPNRARLFGVAGDQLLS